MVMVIDGDGDGDGDSWNGSGGRMRGRNERGEVEELRNVDVVERWRGGDGDSAGGGRRQIQ